MVAFLVLKLPRTGSSMFGRVLDAHPSIECRNEYLNRVNDRPKAEIVDTLRSFYLDPKATDGEAVPDAKGQTMNPFKYGLGASDIASAFGQGWLGGAGRRLTARARSLPVRLLTLNRDDVLRQAVSQASAKQLGSYKSSRTMVEDASVLEAQEFDTAELVRLVRSLSEKARRMRAIADALHAERLDITYEQLVADQVGTFESVFTFLGVEPAPADFDYSAGYTKMLSEDLRDVVANYEDLEREPTLARYLEADRRVGQSA